MQKYDKMFAKLKNTFNHYGFVPNPKPSNLIPSGAVNTIRNLSDECIRGPNLFQLSDCQACVATSALVSKIKFYCSSFDSCQITFPVYQVGIPPPPFLSSSTSFSWEMHLMASCLAVENWSIVTKTHLMKCCPPLFLFIRSWGGEWNFWILLQKSDLHSWSIQGKSNYSKVGDTKQRQFRVSFCSVRTGE